MSYNIGRVRVLTGMSCLEASCLWSELSVIYTDDIEIFQLISTKLT